MLLDRLQQLVPKSPLFNNVINGAKKVVGAIGDQVRPIVQGTGEFAADTIQRAVNLPSDMVEAAGAGGEAFGKTAAGIGLMMEEPRRQQTVVMNKALRQQIKDKAAAGKLTPEKAQAMQAGLPKDSAPPLVQEIEKNPIMFGAINATKTAIGIGSIFSLINVAKAGIQGLMAMDGGKTAGVTQLKKLDELFPHSAKHITKDPFNETLNSKLAAGIIEDTKKQVAGSAGMNNPELASSLDKIDPTTIKSWGDLFSKMTDAVKHNPTAVDTIKNHVQTRWSMYITDPAFTTKVIGPEFAMPGAPVTPAAPTAAKTVTGITPKEYSKSFHDLSHELTKTPAGKTAVVMGTLRDTGPDQFTKAMVSDMIKTLGGLDKAVKNPLFKQMIEKLFINLTTM